MWWPDVTRLLFRCACESMRVGNTGEIASLAVRQKSLKGIMLFINKPKR
jgi:hypothetical protein